MERIFAEILQMSNTAAWVILAVLLVRVVLRKAPKKYSYWLWSVVGFRLCCPVTWRITLPAWALRLFSREQWGPAPAAPVAPVTEVTPVAPPTVTADIVTQNPLLAPVAEALPAPNPAASVDPIQVWLFIGAVIWCVGVVILLTYSVVSYFRLRRRMETAILLRDNIYQSDKVRSPFILGFVWPKIYIPFGLDEKTSRYVLSHEGYHLRRRDHLIRAFAFLVLSVHWFNPLCWLSFYLMGKDMEMSCDEKVLSKEKGSVKDYSMSLLSFAANRRFPAPSPLAFGETAVKSRIKNVLHWRRPKTWVTLVSALLCLLVVVSCSADPAEEPETPQSEPVAVVEQEQEQSPADLPEEPSEEQPIPDNADAPNEPETPAEPETPTESEAPAEPQTPDEPETSDEPEETAEEQQAEILYAKILEIYYNGITSGNWGASEDEIYYGPRSDDWGEADEVSYMWPFYFDGTLADAGYCIKDLNQDGVPELLVSPVADAAGGEIYDLFTCADGEVIHLAASGERDAFYLCTDNTIAEYGSGGAFFSVWNYYDVKTGEHALYCKETVVYDGEKDEDNPWFYGESPWYQQTEWGQELDYESLTHGTETEAESIINSYELAAFELTTFDQLSAG